MTPRTTPTPHPTPASPPGRRRAQAQANVQARQQAEVRRLEGLPVVQAHAAGIDIGSRSHWACAGPDLTQEFPAHTEGLHALVAWPRQHQVTTVAMEST